MALSGQAISVSVLLAALVLVILSLRSIAATVSVEPPNQLGHGSAFGHVISMTK
jgi:hypothetical protein